MISKEMPKSNKKNWKVCQKKHVTKPFFTRVAQNNLIQTKQRDFLRMPVNDWNALVGIPRSKIIYSYRVQKFTATE